MVAMPMRYLIMRHIIGVVVWMLALAVVSLATADDAPKRYICRRTASPITIDGNLTENVWKQVPVMTDFTVLGTAAKPAYPTKAWMCYDDRNLYVAFVATSEDIWATMTKHDEYLYEEEVVEIFIDPDGDGKNYIELEINPLNNVFDLLMLTGIPWKGKADWDIKDLTHAVRIYGTLNYPEDADERWVVEMAIPFKNFKGLGGNNIPPQEGDEWRLNLYRHERGKQFRSKPECTAWSPIKGEGSVSFHTPQKFGYVTFE